MNETNHVCSCGDCSLEPYQDECKYETLLKVVVAAKHSEIALEYALTRAEEILGIRHIQEGRLFDRRGDSPG